MSSSPPRPGPESGKQRFLPSDIPTQKMSKASIIAAIVVTTQKKNRKKNHYNGLLPTGISHIWKQPTQPGDPNIPHPTPLAPSLAPHLAPPTALIRSRDVRVFVYFVRSLSNRLMYGICYLYSSLRPWSWCPRGGTLPPSFLLPVVVPPSPSCSSFISSRQAGKQAALEGIERGYIASNYVAARDRQNT